MKLYDERERARKEKQSAKLNRNILISIIIIIVLIIIITVVMLYLMYDPNKITLKLNGNENQEILNMLDIQVDEKGEMIIYAPIKKFAEKIGYKSYNGEYSIKSEDTNKCYIINDFEVIEFEKDSKYIYKLNLEDKATDYEECMLESKVSANKNNGELYIDDKNMAEAFNVDISYNKQTRTINIITLDTMISAYQKYVNTKIYEKIDESYANKKSVLDDLIIVDGLNKEKGVLRISGGKVTELLESKYDDIKYIPYDKSFLIKSNGKVGIIGADGNTKVAPTYDTLTLINKDNNLYLASQNGLYGVIDGDGNSIIHNEYNKVGIDIKPFSDTGIKTGYILADTLIPVSLNGKWGFYNIKGEKLTELVYDQVGCTGNSTSNVYNLLVVPGYNVIVAGKEKKFTLIDTTGTELFNSIVDKMYMKISNGEKSFVMETSGQTLDIIEYLKKKGLKSEEEI